MTRSALQKSRLSFFLLFSVLLFCLLLAPFTLPSGSVQDLSGKVGSIDNWERYQEMNPFALAVYLFGDANCHQIADRSFSLNHNQLPVCSRDLGIFIGAVLGFALTFFWQRKPSLYLVAALLLPILIDGGWQALSEYESNNWLRLVTGTLAGIALALFLTWLAFELLLPSKHPENALPPVTQR